MHDFDFLRERIEESLKLLHMPSLPGNLYDPIRYTLGFGGKRIRPVTCLLACELFGTDYRKALPAALSVEIFHNFTLLHDDIMDQAPLRRGKASVYRKWDTNVAILSGDTMFALAYSQLMDISHELLPEVLAIFSKTAIEVCEGQQYDMEFESRSDVSIDEYLKMIHLKTAVLLAASVQIGAVCGGAGKADSHTLYNFGLNTGMGFQLMDDYLDTYGDEEVFGKKTGSDIIAGKKTYLLLRALELEQQAGSTELIESLKDSDPNEKVMRVTSILDRRGVREEVRSLISEFHVKALEALSQIDTDTSSLASMAESLLNREF